MLVTIAQIFEANIDENHLKSHDNIIKARIQTLEKLQWNKHWFSIDGDLELSYVNFFF